MLSGKFFLSISGLLLLLGSFGSFDRLMVPTEMDDEPVTTAPKTAFDSLSFDEKIDLMIAVSVKRESDLTGLDPKQNLFIDQSITSDFNFETIPSYKGLSIMNVENLDAELPSNLQLGAAKEKEAVGVKYDELAMRSNLVGANVVLSKEFNQLILSGKFNAQAYTQSPYFNQQYWKTSQKAMFDHGVLLGGKGFFGKLEANRQSLAVLQTFHFAGLRELARSDMSMLQIESAVCKKLDTLPAAQSALIIKDIIRDNQGFKGILLSPDFSKKTLTEQAELALKSIKAGIDLVVVDRKVKPEIHSALAAHFKKRKKRLDEKVRRIFMLRRTLNKMVSDPRELVDVHQFQYQSDVAALTVLKNDNNVWPIKELNQPFAVASSSIDFESQVIQYVDFEPIDFDVSLKENHVAIVLGKDQDLGTMTAWLKTQTFQQSLLIVDYADLYRYRSLDWTVFDGVIVCPTYETEQINLAIQAGFGAVSLQGKLPFYLNPTFPTFSGASMQSIQRLAYTAPESLGLNPVYLKRIDSIAQAAIKAGAFPGCQIQMTWKGHVVYQSAQGQVAHNKPTPTDMSVIYDLASITKIAGSTIGLMSLDEAGKLNLNNRLKELWSGTPNAHPMGNILLKDMMAHQAGLPAWIPFYTKTVNGGQPMEAFYANKKTAEKSTTVAKDLFILDSYEDSIYQRIFDQNLRDKKYKYSDLGYYFVLKIIEQQSGRQMADYLTEKFYSPLGLRTLNYHPLKKFDKDRIAPTEYDRYFRQQLVHGHVHDPGAAMLGGVGGHAGLFSNANDLSVLMQMLLNGGTYGGRQYLSKSTIDQYTAVQFPGKNRRGAGFDKPKEKTGGGTCADECSAGSYGHSGFTGTLTWVDPKYDLNYVFLSNRVNPDAENWKIVRMNVRTDIQSQMIAAIQNANVKTYFASWDLVDLKKIENQ